MKVKISFILLFLMIGAICAYAESSRDLVVSKELDRVDSQNQTQTPAASNVFYERVHTFSLDQQFFYSQYHEPQKSRTVVGSWGAIEGKYVFRPSKGSIFNTPVFNYYSFETLYGAGKNELREQEQRFSDGSFTRLTLKNIPGYMFEERFLLGRDLLPRPSVRLTPYTGLGIRYKTDHSADHYNVYDSYFGFPVAALGYNFSDLYYYIPLGLTIALAQNRDYQLSWTSEYDFLVHGYERDDYSDFDQYTLPSDGYTNQNFKYSLDHGWGYRTSFKLLKHFALMDVYLEPYLRYWHISPSKGASGMVEGGNFNGVADKNSSLELGSSLGLQF